jgi:methionyl-tRNA formyltransferase
MKIPPMHNTPLRYIYFGTPQTSVDVLAHMAEAGMLPLAIVTNPDAPKGRGMALTPSPLKEWALAHAIPVLQPETIKGNSAFVDALHTLGGKEGIDLFIVVAYGKILPKEIIDLPRRGTLNVHFSLLPKWRGASPVQSAILADDKKTGVSIMLLDERMDHGPVIAIHEEVFEEWPTAKEVEARLAAAGGTLLATVAPQWAAAAIKATPQDESQATYAQKITKAQGQIVLPAPEATAAECYALFRKIQAFTPWPGTYFFTKDGKRIIIKSAEWKNDSLMIRRVVPEGRREMDFSDFMRSKD